MAEQFLHGVEVINIDDGTRPITTAASSVIGIVGTAPRAGTDFPINQPVLVTSRQQAAKLRSGTSEQGEGTLPDAIDAIFDQGAAVVVMIRVDGGASEATALAAVVGGTNPTDGQYQGAHALLSAESVLGVKPRLLIAPGFTHQRPEDPDNVGTPLANPVVAALKGIATKLRAVVVADGPDTNDAAAILSAGDHGSQRVFLVDPGVKRLNAAGEITVQPASATVAGAISRSDNERGWWASPSNIELNGVLGTTRAVDFCLDDATSRANQLNAKNVATIIRQNGFRLWGNRTLAVDGKWQFLCVVRTADIIADSLQAAHLWAVDRGITKTYADDVRDGVQAYLRNLVANGAILGGDCWIDPELNTAENIKAGKFYWDFDFTPTYPGEHLTFRMHMNDNYISEIF